MKKHFAVLYRISMAVILTALVLSACSSPAAPQNTAQTQAVIAAQLTLTARPSETPAWTDTPEPTATATITPTETATPTATPAPYGPTGFPANVNPLTGQILEDPTILDRAPVMIKVSNYPASGRPHSGLSLADIVFEYYIGNGMNRFMGLFYGQDAPKVGPIRSGRLVDAQLVPLYNGILGYSGAWDKVEQTIRNALGNRAIASSPSLCPAICDTGAHTVVSVFSDTAALTDYAQGLGIGTTRPNLDGMSFDPTAPQGGQPATDVLVQYSYYNRGEWIYDPSSGKYLRWIEELDGQNNIAMIELVDANTGEQLAFSNVVILFGTYIEYAASLHDITVAGNTYGQRALLFRDGMVYEGTWKSVGANKPLQFFGQDGEPLDFKPGNTWMAFMGLNSTIDQTDNGATRITFYMP